MLLGASRCADLKVKPDAGMTAIEGQDATALNEIDGCGPQPVVGFNYCRRMEGDATGTSFAFLAPPVLCKSQDACVYFKVYFPNGEPSYGDKIPVGQTRVSVPWKKLTKKDTFDAGDRGEWSYTYEIHWIDLDGHERMSVSKGEIVLRVYKKGYEPLHNVPEDPNFVWTWMDGGNLYRMTTGMRAYVGPAPSPSPGASP